MIPPILVGGSAKSANITTYGVYDLTEVPSMVLPVTIAAYSPYWISIFGLAAIR